MSGLANLPGPYRGDWFVDLGPVRVSLPSRTARRSARQWRRIVRVHRRLGARLDRYAGRWVAVRRRRVIADGESRAELEANGAVRSGDFVTMVRAQYGSRGEIVGAWHGDRAEVDR